MKKLLIVLIPTVVVTVAAILLGRLLLDSGGRPATWKAVELQTRYRSGLELARVYQLERALLEFEACLSMDPDHALSRFQRGRMLLGLGREEEGRADIEEALRLDPDNTRMHRFLYELYRDPEKGFPPKAVTHLRALRAECGELVDFDLKLWDAITRTGSMDPYRLAASMLRGQRDLIPPDQREIYDAFFPGGNEDPGVQGIPGYMAFQRLFERCPGGLRELREAVAAELSNPSRLGLPPATDGRVPGSSIPLELCQHILEDIMDYSVLHSGRSLDLCSMMALLLMKMGDFRSAIPRFRWVLESAKLKPNESVRLQNLFYTGVCHYKLGEHDEARRVFRGILEDPTRPGLAAWFLHLLGDLELPLRASRFPDELRQGLEFREVAEELGVAKFDAGGSSSWGDYDRDGDLDLFVSGCDTYSILYRNDGGRFTDATAEAGLKEVQSGFSNLFVDYDGDGHLDVFVARDGWAGPGPQSLYHNQGDATYEDITGSSGLNPDPQGSSFTSAWLDYDRDGKLDLLVANGVCGDRSGNRLFRHEGGGKFTNVTSRAGLAEKPGTRTIGCAVGDYNRDGWPDIFFSGMAPSPNRLYRNRGDGTFVEIARPAGVDDTARMAMGFVAFFEDLDGDAWPDIFMAKWEPSFQRVKDAMMEDYIPDEDSLRSAPKLFRNLRNGTFQDISEAAGFVYPHGAMSGGIVDLNNDGHLDVYVGTGGPAIQRLEPDAFYLNLGDGQFTNVARPTGLDHVGKGHGLAFADYDRDGDLDFYLPVGAAFMGDFWKNRFYINVEGSRLHWLQVLLVGTRSHPMAVGAQVEARAGGLTVYREKKCGVGFGACDGPHLHFGLGGNEKVDTLEVRWPSGLVETFREIAADQHIRIVEGDGKWEKETW